MTTRIDKQIDTARDAINAIYFEIERQVNNEELNDTTGAYARLHLEEAHTQLKYTRLAIYNR